LGANQISGGSEACYLLLKGLTPLPPSCADFLEIWETQTLEPLGPVKCLYMECCNFYLLPNCSQTQRFALSIRTPFIRLCGPGKRSRYGESLRAEKSWDRILVEGHFPHLSRPALRLTLHPVQGVPGLSRG
jgi:hypothetical protein